MIPSSPGGSDASFRSQRRSNEMQHPRPLQSPLERHKMPSGVAILSFRYLLLPDDVPPQAYSTRSAFVEILSDRALFHQQVLPSYQISDCVAKMAMICMPVLVCKPWGRYAFRDFGRGK